VVERSGPVAVRGDDGPVREPDLHLSRPHPHVSMVNRQIAGVSHYHSTGGYLSCPCAAVFQPGAHTDSLHTTLAPESLELILPTSPLVSATLSVSVHVPLAFQLIGAMRIDNRDPGAGRSHHGGDGLDPAGDVTPLPPLDVPVGTRQEAQDAGRDYNDTHPGSGHSAFHHGR
jgi:hypothetical protein